MAACYCRPPDLHGGSAIFVCNEITATKIMDLCSITQPFLFEVCSIFIHSMNLLCITFYRTPGSSTANFNAFLNNLNDLFQLIYKKEKVLNIILAGDFNIYFLYENTSEVRDIVNLLTSFGA